MLGAANPVLLNFAGDDNPGMLNIIVQVLIDQEYDACGWSCSR